MRAAHLRELGAGGGITAEPGAEPGLTDAIQKAFSSHVSTLRSKQGAAPCSEQARTVLNGLERSALTCRSYSQHRRQPEVMLVSRCDSSAASTGTVLSSLRHFARCGLPQ